MISRGRILAAVAVVAVLAGLALGAREVAEAPRDRALVEGRVVDEHGAAVAGASVDLGAGTVVRSDVEGRFRGAVPAGPRLVTASAEDHLPRTLAVEPGTPTEVVLTAQASRTVSVRIGGDVMFGRRYYDRDDDGDRSDALLPDEGSVEQHAALLEHVRPLLEDADLTVVNLETPLVEEPYVDPTTARPAGWHPTKEFVFGSRPESVRALLDAGVDLVSLGNNHVLDALGPGLDSTLAALDDAGLPRFGAGRTPDEAWAPAVVERKGQRLAFLGCTTITGTEHAITYVADDTHGGAARCGEDRLRREVAAARQVADVVVVMVHGGEEYEAEQTELVRRLSRAAVEAGAAVVANGHPHVVGGMSLEGGALVAETTGNLLFDQTVWPTFLSYLLRVDLREGAPVLATVDPLLLEGYVPRPVVGLLADAAGRRAAGLVPGASRLHAPGAALAPGRTDSTARTQEQLEQGSLHRLAPGWWVPAPVAGAVRVGTDLLWTGSFEDMDTDTAREGAHEWAEGPNVARSAGAACAGTAGMELRRSAVSTQDVVLTPTHRQLATAGASLSLLAEVRAASPGGRLELALFPDTKGPSSSTLSVPVPVVRAGGACTTVRLDAVLPPGTVAVQPFVRLPSPPGDLRVARLQVDDVRLVQWAPPGASGRRYDTIEARDDVAVELVSDRADPAAGPFLGP